MIDVDRLAGYLDRVELPGRGGPLEVDFVSGGTQNEIYQVRRGNLHGALRMPPASAPASRDEGILREWRILAALDGTDVPHASAVNYCNDPGVLGRPFYIMGWVDGWSPMGVIGTGGPKAAVDRSWPEPFHSDLEMKRSLAYELVNGIVLMGRVDWQARGLADLGRPEGFHERQVERWSSFLARVKGRDIPGYEEASRWLRDHRPLDFVPGLMHGDYQFPNVMFRSGGPARLAAIVDCEMGTIGDPKLDLGWVAHGWPEDTSPEALAGSVGFDQVGMPNRTELIEYYSRQSGRQVDDMDYYLVLAQFKLAIVLEQGYQRAGSDPKLQAFGDVVLQFMSSAAELAETSDYRG